jgi:plastocyanin
MTTAPHPYARYAIAFALLLAAGCGGGSSSNPPTSPTPPTPTTTTAPPTTTTAPPTNTTTITITAAGVNPQSITVSPGTRVTFVNSDSRSHEMNSDPHPTHGDCPGIDDIGFLAPGQSKQTGNLNVTRTCGFHDHNQPDVRSLQGQIIVR